MNKQEALELKPGDMIIHIRSGKEYVVDKFDIKNRVEEHIKAFMRVK